MHPGKPRQILLWVAGSNWVVVPYKSRKPEPEANIRDPSDNESEADPVLGRRQRPPSLSEFSSEQVKRAKGGADGDRKELARLVVLDEHDAQQADQDEHSPSSGSESDDSIAGGHSERLQPEALLVNLSQYSNQPALLHVQIIE